MTPDAFHALALALPDAVEGAHQGHPDFRVGGKIFATLAPDGAWGMVKLTPEQQAERLAAHPGAFEPASGAWGRGGATLLHLDRATKSLARAALADAHANVAR